MSGPIELFVLFSEERLTYHREKLDSKNQKNTSSVDQINKSYQSHRELFSKELNEEIIRVAGTGEPWLAARLKMIKHDYESKLLVLHNEAIIIQKINEYL